MSVLSKGKGRRTTTRMLVTGVSVGARAGKGLSISLYGRDGAWLNIALDEEHAESLRRLISTADVAGESSVASMLNGRLAKRWNGALDHLESAIDAIEAKHDDGDPRGEFYDVPGMDPSILEEGEHEGEGE